MRIEWIERLKAELGGYFWLPCPNCGRMFGGQESKHGGVLWQPSDPFTGSLTCTDPVCKQQVRERNHQNQLDWWSKTEIDLANEDAEGRISMSRNELPSGALPLTLDALSKIRGAIMGVTLTPEQAEEIIQLVKLCIPPATMDDCASPVLSGKQRGSEEA